MPNPIVSAKTNPQSIPPGCRLLACFLEYGSSIFAADKKRLPAIVDAH